jgi:hypothetical protein
MSAANPWESYDTENDFCNGTGAAMLKIHIEAYWRSRGYDVEVKLIDAGFVSAMRSARKDIRSDMKNGFPTRIAESQAA